MSQSASSTSSFMNASGRVGREGTEGRKEQNACVRVCMHSHVLQTSLPRSSRSRGGLPRERKARLEHRLHHIYGRYRLVLYTKADIRNQKQWYVPWCSDFSVLDDSTPHRTATRNPQKHAKAEEIRSKQTIKRDAKQVDADARRKNSSNGHRGQAKER